MVIQRWQSLLLLVAAVMMGCYTFFTLGQIQTTEYTFRFTSLGFFYEGEPTDGAPGGTLINTWYFFILSLTTAVVLLADIFLYRNLNLQKRICLVGILMVIASAATCFALGYQAIEGALDVDWNSMSFIAPILALCASVLAYNRMQSDDRKLKAADRIR